MTAMLRIVPAFVLTISAFAAAPAQETSPDKPAPGASPEKKAAKIADAIYPAAILPFEERGANVKDLGQQVSDLLFAQLAADPALFLVDRAEFNKTLSEQSLAVSGAVKPTEAVQVGQLTGARLLITGSVLQVDKRLYLVAKVMGTETSRVFGASVNGKASDEIGPLVTKLAEQISTTVTEQGDKLVARPVEKKDRLASLRKELGEGKRPTVRIEVAERHVGRPTIDPAVEAELQFLCKELGFEIVDSIEGTAGAADYFISGQGFSEQAARIAGLVSVKARVELKIVDRRTGRVVASDRQTTLVIDASEQIAAKSALQEAAAALAERMLPKVFAPARK